MKLISYYMQPAEEIARRFGHEYSEEVPQAVSYAQQQVLQGVRDALDEALTYSSDLNDLRDRVEEIRRDAASQFRSIV